MSGQGERTFGSKIGSDVLRTLSIPRTRAISVADSSGSAAGNTAAPWARRESALAAPVVKAASPGWGSAAPVSEHAGRVGKSVLAAQNVMPSPRQKLVAPCTPPTSCATASAQAAAAVGGADRGPAAGGTAAPGARCESALAGPVVKVSFTQQGSTLPGGNMHAQRARMTVAVDQHFTWMPPWP